MEMIILSNGTIINYYISGSNCKVFESFKIKNKKLKYEFINILLKRHSQFQKRTVKSYYRECKAHNILYKLHFLRSSTRDTDLSINESLIRRIGYFIISIFSIDF